VIQKQFYESYRVRDTGTGLIAHAFGIVKEPSAPVVATNGPVTVRAWLDSATYVFFQRVMLNVEVSIAPGHHVYSQPVSDGFTPLSIEIDALEGLQVGPARWPTPRRVTGQSFNDETWVYQGDVRGTVPLTFAAAPGGGDHNVAVTVHYQACHEGSCFAASSVRLRLPVREAALFGRSLPSSASKT